MLAMHIKIDEKSLREAKHILRAIPKAIPRVFRRAINRNVDMAATDLKRRVSGQVTFKKRDIAKSIKKHKATYKHWVGYIGASTHRPGLLAYPGTIEKRPHGVKYRISRTAGRKRLPSAFIATMPISGHRGVFERRSISRLPIDEMRGPSIWSVITRTPQLLKSVTDAAGKRMSKLINDQIGVEFRRWKR